MHGFLSIDLNHGRLKGTIVTLVRLRKPDEILTKYRSSKMLKIRLFINRKKSHHCEWNECKISNKNNKRVKLRQHASPWTIGVQLRHWSPNSDSTDLLWKQWRCCPFSKKCLKNTTEKVNYSLWVNGRKSKRYFGIMNYFNAKLLNYFNLTETAK